MPKRRCLLLGMPGSGKTTFLAAVWHTVSINTNPSLRMQNLAGDVSYLTEIREHWLAYEKVPRNLIESVRDTTMHLVDREGNETELWIPDLSGEDFRSYFKDRAWGHEFDDLLLGLSGTLLFAHPDEFVIPPRISETHDVVAEAGGDGAPAGFDPSVSWDPHDSPTQVKLVDLLQLIAHRRPSRKPLRIGVIVSAWDVLDQTGRTPQEWVERESPLLHQFLATNASKNPFRIFGVSAQGGDYEHDFEALADLNPSERTLVVEGDGTRHHDVTVPLRWILSKT